MPGAETGSAPSSGNEGKAMADSEAMLPGPVHLGGAQTVRPTRPAGGTY